MTPNFTHMSNVHQLQAVCRGSGKQLRVSKHVYLFRALWDLKVTYLETGLVLQEWFLFDLLAGCIARC